uniref:Uncharacterized protein n=1 Tax=Tanacetum cinerariifolium TaxID=118510 RepID=A0A699GZ95_TANCI|nr:hypothetical protein [Tanacetum cinerariifolium]
MKLTLRLHFSLPLHINDNEPPLTEGHTSVSGEGRLEENIELTNTVPTPHDSPITRGCTPGSDEGRITLAELMETCTTLSNRVTQLENKLLTTKDVYNKAIINLTNRVKMLKSQLKQKRSSAVIHSSDDEGLKEEAEAQGDSDQEVEELKLYMRIILEEYIAIEAIPLAIKPPMIIEEDLETLWKLVKDKYGNTRPKEGYERVLWGDLNIMFEPNIKSEAWGKLQGHEVTV